MAPVLGEADSAGEVRCCSCGRSASSSSSACSPATAVRGSDGWSPPATTKLLVVLFVGFALLVAGIAYQLGVSDAIGAFMAGLVLAGTTVARRVERLVLPLRDAFAAIFFFAFGLAIDPSDIGGVLVPAAIAIVVSSVLAVVAGIVAARINGLDRQGAANIAFSVLARGEFALILVSLAAAAGLDERLAPFVALYVLVLAVASPILASRSGILARRLPERLVPDPAPTA
ncbi:MAG: cation:proton antiporter [Acidimicrobiales bacterium]